MIFYLVSYLGAINYRYLLQPIIQLLRCQENDKREKISGQLWQVVSNLFVFRESVLLFGNCNYLFLVEKYSVDSAIFLLPINLSVEDYCDSDRR